MNIEKRKRTKGLNKFKTFDKKNFEVIDEDFKVKEFR